MPTNAVSAARPTYPGVYVEELPSSTRAISAVTTSVTAFVGHTRRGPLNEPVRVTGFAEFERRFGGLSAQSPLAYAVHQFFGNGGSVAVIVRVAKAGSGKTACVVLESTDGRSESPVLEVHAKEPGVWGNSLRVAVDYDTTCPDETFNLRVHDARGEARESFTGLSMDMRQRNLRAHGDQRRVASHPRRRRGRGTPRPVRHRLQAVRSRTARPGRRRDGEDR